MIYILKLFIGFFIAVDFVSVKIELFNLTEVVVKKRFALSPFKWCEKSIITTLLFVIDRLR
jgi:hypothetical protein